MYERIVKGDNFLTTGLPESFHVLVKELQGLCLNMELIEDEPVKAVGKGKGKGKGKNALAEVVRVASGRALEAVDTKTPAGGENDGVLPSGTDEMRES